MDMCLNVWYRLDLRGKLKFGGTSEGVLIDAFSDGRLCSVVMEHVLPEYFQNLVRCSSNGARFDLNMVTDVPWMFRTIELKCNTTNGIKFIQSKNIGVGREFDETDNLKWIKRTDAFLVCDISEFPIVNLKLVDSVEIIGIAGFKLSSGDCRNKFFKGHCVEIDKE